MTYVAEHAESHSYSDGNIIEDSKVKIGVF